MMDDAGALLATLKRLGGDGIFKHLAMLGR
jgi:hypothetical protein